MFNAIVEALARVNDEFEQIVKKFTCQNNEEVAIDIRRNTVAIPDKPAYIDFISRRCDIFNAASKMAQEVLGSIGGKVVTMSVLPFLLAGTVGKEISDVIIDQSRKSELIYRIETARQETKYVIIRNIFLSSIKLSAKKIFNG